MDVPRQSGGIPVPRPEAKTQLLPTELKEPDFSDEERAAYTKALKTLDENGIAFLIGGANALHAYTGIWRNTKDIDLFLKPEDIEDALAVLREAGLDTEVVDPVWLSKAWGEGDVMIDIICRNANGLGAVADDWWDRAPRADILDRDVALVPAENLFLSKMFVGFRDRWDGADLMHLLFATGGDLDWGYIEKTAGEHWMLLLTYLNLFMYTYPAHRDYLPNDLYDRLLDRAKRVEPEEEKRFRGTLYDSVSFRVDVTAWELPDAREAMRRNIDPDATP